MPYSSVLSVTVNFQGSAVLDERLIAKPLTDEICRK
jgi:hypothetical protein